MLDSLSSAVFRDALRFLGFSPVTVARLVRTTSPRVAAIYIQDAIDCGFVVRSADRYEPSDARPTPPQATEKE